MASRTLAVSLRATVQGYTGPMRQAAAATGTVEASLLRLQRAGAGVAQVGDTLTRRVSIPIALVGAAAAKMAIDFDQSFAQMRGLAGVAADEVDGLKDAVLGLAGETGRAPQELAKALYFIRSSGIDGKRALDALEVSAKAAASGLGSTEVVADAVTSAMNAYATSGMTAARATDVLVATAREGKAEPAELAAQMGRLLPVASQLGISFEDVGAAIATLSLNGNDAATSTTQLSNVMTKLLKPSQQGAEALAAVGLSAEQVKEMIAERGLLGTLEELRARLGESGFVKFLEDQQAVQGGLALLGGDLEATRDRFDRLGDSAGASADAFTKTDSDARTLQKAWADMQATLIDLGSAIAPVVADIANMAGAFTDLPDGIQTSLIYLGLFMAALGPIMSIGGRVVTGLSAMYTALANLAVPANATAGAFNGTAVASSRLASSLVSLGKVGAVVGILFAVREAVGTIADDVERADLSKLENQLLDLADTGEVTGGTLRRVFGELDRSAGGAEQMRADLNQLDDALAKLAGRDPEAAAAAFRRIKDELRDMGATEDQIEGKFDSYEAALAEVDTANRTTGDAVSDAAGAIDEQTGSLEAATTALQDYATQLAAQFDPLFGMQSALAGLEDSQVGVAEAQGRLNEAIAGGDPTAIATAQRDYDDALRGAQGAIFDVQQAQITLNDAIARGDVSLADAQTQMYDWAIAAGFTHDEAMTMAGGLATATQKAQELGQQNPVVDATVNDQASGPISTIDQKVRNLDGAYARVTIETLQRTIFSQINAGDRPTGRQHGGTVHANRLYEVAEGGRAELLHMAGHSYLIPGANGTIAPSMSAAGAGSAGGRGMTLVVQVNSPFGSPSEIGTRVVESIKAFERNNGAGWRG